MCINFISLNEKESNDPRIETQIQFIDVRPKDIIIW